MWGIPYNLYAPYVSIYMLALGLSDKQIGLTVSISWGFQIIMALLSGVVTDKLGRRRTTLIFDILSWSVPALISALAQNYWYFLAAAVINSLWRVTHNSWTCLLVEDADQGQLVDIYSWIYIANIVVGFIAPLAGAFIAAFSLVPTMRGLYIFAAIMFTLKAIVTYRMTEETRQGKVRMHETRHQSIFDVLGEYKGVFRTVLHSPQTLYTAGILLVLGISSMISGSFWAIIVTEKLHVPAQNLAYLSIYQIGHHAGILFCGDAAHRQNALQAAAVVRFSRLCPQPVPPGHRSRPGVFLPRHKRIPGSVLLRHRQSSRGQDGRADN